MAEFNSILIENLQNLQNNSDTISDTDSALVEKSKAKRGANKKYYLVETYDSKT